jgi:hypothetical protein
MDAFVLQFNTQLFRYLMVGCRIRLRLSHSYFTPQSMPVECCGRTGAVSAIRVHAGTLSCADKHVQVVSGTGTDSQYHQ